MSVVRVVVSGATSSTPRWLMSGWVRSPTTTSTPFTIPAVATVAVPEYDSADRCGRSVGVASPMTVGLPT